MDIKQLALRKALRTLDALGAAYAVVFAGEKHGILELAPEKAKNPPAYNNERKFNYIQAVDNMKVGDVLTYNCESHEEAVSLRGSLGSRGARTRGPGGVTTHLQQVDGVWQAQVMAVLPCIIGAPEHESA